MKKSLIATALCLTATLAAPLSAWAAPVKSLFLGADNGLSAVMNDIIGNDVRFDVQNSGVMAGQSVTPTLAQLQQYDSVLYWTNYYPANSVSMGNVLADFVDQGGLVVRATFIGQEVPNQGRIGSADYAAFTAGRGDAYNSACLGNSVTSHEVMSGVNTLCANTYRGDWNAQLAPGAQLLASWNDGRPFVGINADQNVIDISLFPNAAMFSHATGDYRTLFANALAFGSTNGNAVPEPAGLALVLVALAGAGALRRR